MTYPPPGPDVFYNSFGPYTINNENGPPLTTDVQVQTAISQALNQIQTLQTGQQSTQAIAQAAALQIASIQITQDATVTQINAVQAMQAVTSTQITTINQIISTFVSPAVSFSATVTVNTSPAVAFSATITSNAVEPAVNFTARIAA